MPTVPRFDIFERLPEGPMWVEAIDSIEIAKTRLHKLASVRSGTFLLFDTRTGTFIEEMSGDADRIFLLRSAKA